MSTLKTTYIQHPDAASAAIELTAAGTVALPLSGIGDLADVDEGLGAADGDVLTYDGVGNVWVPATFPSYGQVFITKVAVSTVSSISLDNIFTSDYDGYHIITNLTGSGSGGLAFRFRASGSDDSSAQYNAQRINAQGTVIHVERLENQTSLPAGGVYSVTNQISDVLVFNPHLSQRTSGHIRGMQDGGSAIFANPLMGFFDVATSTAYDGISFLPSTGTINGTVYVYGLTK